MAQVRVYVSELVHPRMYPPALCPNTSASIEYMTSINPRYRSTVLKRKLIHKPVVKPIVKPFVLIRFEAVFLVVHKVVLKAILKAILVLLRPPIQSPSSLSSLLFPSSVSSLCPSLSFFSKARHLHPPGPSAQFATCPQLNRLFRQSALVTYLSLLKQEH
jgi:hypothetical protein